MFPVGSSCMFPPSWRGAWFGSDFGDVIIGQSNISHKGTCVDVERGYYLMDNAWDSFCLTDITVMACFNSLLYYPHMPIGMLGIYRLLFVCLFVCPQHRNHNGQVNGQGVGCHATPPPPAFTLPSRWQGIHGR